MKKILAALFLSVLLFNFAGASLQEHFTAQADMSEMTLNDEQCHSFANRMILKIIKNFSFEVKTTDTQETIFVIVRENDCTMSLEVDENFEGKADITLSGLIIDGQYSPNQIESNTFKGRIFGSMISKSIK